MSDGTKNILIWAVIIAVFVLWGLDVATSPSSYTLSDDTTTSEMEQETQAEVEPTENAERQTFNAYDCTDDCSGHEAGYQWAEDNNVCDDDFDGGNSESFAEGVRSYVEDNCY